MSKLSDYVTIGDSVSLTKLGDKAFTITHVEDSYYESAGEKTEGVKITTKESFDVEGTPCSKFHTSRVAVTRRLKNEKLRDDVNNKGLNLGPVKCVEEKAKNGKMFFNLVDA